MDSPLFVIAVIVVLTLANGLFASSELALVSARRSRLEGLAEEGNRAAKLALDLSERPGALLATVQVGITLIGTINSIFAGENLVRFIEPGLRPYFGSATGTVSYVLIVLLVTFVSLVLGELAPKRLALRDPEGLAMRVAPLMALLEAVTRPIVWVLDRTATLLLRLVGVRGERQQDVTEEDVRALVEQATESGSLEAGESELIERVLRFNDRRVREVMTPRVELVMLDLDQPVPSLLENALHLGHSRYPVYTNGPDNIVGLLRRDDLLAVALDPNLPVASAMREPLYVPESAWANDVLMQLNESKQYEALVVDEYGDLAGMVTANDLISELVGVFGDEREEAEMLVRRPDGSFLADGALAMHDLREILALPAGDEEAFTTLAGYVLSHTGSIPNVGERIEVDGWTLEVVDLDGRRIDRLLIVPPEGYVSEDIRAGNPSDISTRPS
ncbi:hemolysin family protein [Deinococcus yavapaiensis]|uniref:Putative hemolysin n=1 Tax=Deinococcus yavapaiensis KR-236 TaxID=694435 RepID=A0A318RZ97_9DEIO|nr:hemolysin family protein [Deinococcus yavapaiensis]PYE48689.1 putative hemolysin [Deinococcus yavapaiensis KR-236]